jgi:hypothetical protein
MLIQTVIRSQCRKWSVAPATSCVRKLTVLSAGRWMSGPRTVRPACPLSEAHQVEARVAHVASSVPEESSDQRHGSQLRTRQLLAFPLCRHNVMLQHKKQATLTSISDALRTIHDLQSWQSVASFGKTNSWNSTTPVPHYQAWIGVQPR